MFDAAVVRWSRTQVRISGVRHGYVGAMDTARILAQLGLPRADGSVEYLCLPADRIVSREYA